MAEFAAIAPLELHKQLDRIGILGDYHMLIASEVIKQPEEWVAYYTNRRRPARVVLDNGMYETGSSISPDYLVDLTNQIAPNYLVLPDVRLDSVASSRATHEFLKHFSDRVNGRTTFMGVIQGNNIDNVFASAQFLLHSCGLHDLCLPRIVGDTCGGRLRVIAELQDRGIDFRYTCNLHLLGISNSIADDIACCKLFPVMGIDSAWPVWSRAVDIHRYDPKEKRPVNFWAQPASENDLRHVIRNISRVRSWFA